MTQIKTKRIYEPAEGTDGFRIIVDRLWPRGIRKEELHYDLWAKDIAPSTPLRRWYHEDMEHRRTAFREKYTAELDRSPAIGDFIDTVKEHKVVTFLYSSKNTTENHALALKEYIEKKLGGVAK